jgi:arginine decarboxylase
MNIRQIQEARELFGIDGWGAGYFGINDQGHVTCHPTGEEHLAVDLPEAIEKCQEQGSRAPIILRFPQIIEAQLEKMHSAFRQAIKDNDYQSRHRGVFPFKVNQRREFIDNIVTSGRKFGYGLEVGSKAEFIAALSYEMADDALLICNGFKDAEFIDMGFIAAAMGKNIILVVEGPDELQLIIDMAKERKICPQVGLRARLYSRGSGKWEKSSGDASKFGLTTIELLQCLDMLEQAGLREKLSMLHFHIGSQITEIKRIKNAIKEASRVYSKTIKMNFKPTYLNIGGGVGVDYDGSKTSFQSSANYSMQEFANDVVYTIAEVCKNEKVQVPEIVTESGRVIAAYHSVVVTNIREVQGSEAGENLDEITFDPKTSHKCLVELKYILDNINRKNFVEYYHDSIEYFEELFTLFNLGYVKLKDRAVGEELYQRVCRRALYFASYENRELEELENLQKLMVSKYLANFSIFQSMPDAWSIDQLFPVMPLSHHSQKPTHKATIVDITCDSDGCLDKFVDTRNSKSVLDLHTPEPGKPYYLGFFLVGAYQESLANEHNLFGAINEAEIFVKSDGSWKISKITKGDPIDELLVCRNYDMKEILDSFRDQIRAAESNGLVKKGQGPQLLRRLKEYTQTSPYLMENVSWSLSRKKDRRKSRARLFERLQEKSSEPSL